LKNNFLINGSYSKKINPFDRGLAFGDGIFRTFLVKNSCPINWDMHYNKLKNDAKILQIKIPTKQQLITDIKKLFSTKKTFIGKIIITRGVSKQGYQFNKDIKNTRIVLKIVYKKINKKFLTDGVRLKVCKTRVSENSIFNGCKHLNRIDNVIAKSELKNYEFDGLMLDKDGFINECASSNIFARFGKIILSPKQINAGISGVCKQIVIKNANLLGLKFKEKNIKLSELKAADEVIITNSIFGALYVNQIEEKNWKEEFCTAPLRKLIIKS
tara:strand:- start:269 stop:1081 length:813 start_codon:yes stop_codon:yes gene_type:complete